MKALKKNRSLVVSVILVVIVLVTFIRLGSNTNRAKKSFREEMALRLDLEEKIVRLEKERSLLISELKKTRLKLTEQREELASQAKALDELLQAKADLEGRLTQASAVESAAVIAGSVPKKDM